MTDQTADRAFAAGAVDETNAAVGTCLCTGEPTADLVALLSWVQEVLTEIATAIDAQHTAKFHTYAAQLDDALQLYSDTSRSESLTARFSLAAGLLRLARTIGQRAARSVAALDDRHLLSAAKFLNTLPRVLDVLATELDTAEDRNVPIGTCTSG